MRFPNSVRVQTCVFTNYEANKALYCERSPLIVKKIVWLYWDNHDNDYRDDTDPESGCLREWVVRQNWHPRVNIGLQNAIEIRREGNLRGASRMNGFWSHREYLSRRLDSQRNLSLPLLSTTIPQMSHPWRPHLLAALLMIEWLAVYCATSQGERSSRQFTSQS